MYRCQKCLQFVPPRTPARHWVIETRARKYPFRELANPGFKRDLEQRRRKGQTFAVRVRSRRVGDRTPDPGGEGTEIVRELMVCPACFVGGQQ